MAVFPLLADGFCDWGFKAFPNILANDDNGHDDGVDIEDVDDHDNDVLP